MSCSRIDSRFRDHFRAVLGTDIHAPLRFARSFIPILNAYESKICQLLFAEVSRINANGMLAEVPEVTLTCGSEMHFLIVPTGLEIVDLGGVG